MGKNKQPKPKFSVSEMCQYKGTNVTIKARFFEEKDRIWLYKIEGAKETGTNRDVFGEAELTRIIHRMKKHMA